MKSVWNPADFMKSVWNPADFRWNPPKPYKIRRVFCWNIRRVFAQISDFIRFGWILPEIHRISWWNPPDFMDFMKSTGFHGEICQISRISWNLPDFMVKSAGFHGEICRISRISWNPPDFMKSAGFHGEIRRISRISWNPPDSKELINHSKELINHFWYSRWQLMMK